MHNSTESNQLQPRLSIQGRAPSAFLRRGFTSEFVALRTSLGSLASTFSRKGPHNAIGGEKIRLPASPQLGQSVFVCRSSIERQTS
jgi:hypothetical protein